ESEYYERYRDLVFSKELKTLSEVFGFDIVFCLHPNMRRFANYFKDAPVRVIDQGEVDVHVLLKERAMMITDYSSVAFDFSFLKKPVVYYQFDRSRFIGKRGSHLDLDNDLPGDIVFEQDELTKLVREYVSEDFQMKDKFAKKASNFLKYNDQNSSQRIYNVIENEMRKKSLIEKILESDIYKALFRKFRKSKLYFPTMKVFYNIARKVIPVDSNLILFESGLGKQYSDSPRSIYEEIVRRNLNYKKIWVSNQRIRFDDVENTKKIKRLSPSYYYYLARSKYWVNNQNFPTYIKKRKNTIYVQTWHGTPLKKMLFDIDNIMGRTPGYLDRVSSAIENWDYLLSPSSYASKAFKSAFQFKGEIIEEGYPRNDVFYADENNQLLQSIKSRLNISKHDKRKIILYAPTFRD